MRVKGYEVPEKVIEACLARMQKNRSHVSLLQSQHGVPELLAER